MANLKPRNLTDHSFKNIKTGEKQDENKKNLLPHMNKLETLDGSIMECNFFHEKRKLSFAF